VKTDELQRWLIVWILSVILGLMLRDCAKSAEYGIAGPEKVGQSEGYFYSLEGIDEEMIPSSQWECIPLSKKAEFELCLVYDPVTKERFPVLYFKAREEGTYTLVFDVNVPDKYGWAVKEVLVGDAVPDDDDDEDDQPDPLKGWALWTKKTAERVIQTAGRAEEAKVLATSLEATVSASAGGAFENAREFRVAIRSSNRAALGEDAWALWNYKFDSLLSQELSALAKQGKFNPNDQQVLRDLYLQVAKGLKGVD
jgi:hypothetical protein